MILFTLLLICGFWFLSTAQCFFSALSFFMLSVVLLMDRAMFNVYMIISEQQTAGDLYR